MKKFKLMEEADASGSVGGAYTPPADFEPADVAVMEKGLDAMDAEFGETAEENLDDDGQVATTPPPEPATTTPAPAAPAPAADPVEGAPNTYKSTTGKVVDTLKPPSGWAAEDALGFADLPEKVRASIHKQEDRFHNGLEAYKAEANFGASLRSAIEPYMPAIQAAGVTPQQAINYLFDVNKRLNQGTPEVRLETVKQIMAQAGVTVEHLSGEPAYVDPAVAALRAELDQVKLTQQTAQQSQVEALRQRAATELDSFIKANPEAEALMGYMLPFLQAGKSLQQAYESAAWTNPATRQARINAEAAAKAEAERKAAEEHAQAAEKARGVKVKVGARNGSPTAPVGSIDETMREVYAKMNQ